MIQLKCNGQIQSESESRWNAPHKDTSYGIVMRPDIYKAFDDRLFTIVREKSHELYTFTGPTYGLGARCLRLILDRSRLFH